jgi:hypothetical protein
MSFSKIKPQFLFQAPEGIRLSAAVGGQPNFSHATTVEHFLKIETPKLLLPNLNIRIIEIRRFSHLQ